MKLYIKEYYKPKEKIYCEQYKEKPISILDFLCHRGFYISLNHLTIKINGNLAYPHNIVQHNDNIEIWQTNHNT